MKGLKKVAQDGRPGDRIPDLANRFGVVRAARQMGIAPATVSKWLKDNGFRKVTRWEKVS